MSRTTRSRTSVRVSASSGRATRIPATVVAVAMPDEVGEDEPGHRQRHEARRGPVRQADRQGRVVVVRVAHERPAQDAHERQRQGERHRWSSGRPRRIGGRRRDAITARLAGRLPMAPRSNPGCRIPAEPVSVNPPGVGQPLGSTMIVTSGVMPLKTLIATLYVPSDLRDPRGRSCGGRRRSHAGPGHRRCPWP